VQNLRVTCEKHTMDSWIIHYFCGGQEARASNFFS